MSLLIGSEFKELTVYGRIRHNMVKDIVEVCSKYYGGIDILISTKCSFYGPQLLLYMHGVPRSVSSTSSISSKIKQSWLYMKESLFKDAIYLALF
jgi:hypothetical protein